MYRWRVECVGVSVSDSDDCQHAGRQVKNGCGPSLPAALTSPHTQREADATQHGIRSLQLTCSALITRMRGLLFIDRVSRPRSCSTRHAPLAMLSYAECRQQSTLVCTTRCDARGRPCLHPPDFHTDSLQRFLLVRTTERVYVYVFVCYHR